MRLLIVTTTALSLLGTAASALAQTSFEPGMYVNINAGRASVSSNYTDDSNDITLGAGAGYQFTRHLGFEVYTRSLSFNPFRGFLAEPGFYPDRHYGIALMGTLPLDQHFNVFGRAGVGRTRMQSTRTSIDSYDETDPTVGLGLGYAFNRNWSLNLEATFLTKTDVHLISFGGRYQF